ncbi:acetolactate decarboxylase [Paenibacillus riograndensis]|uniref:Alpha-acetolactate decarboxylase n=1 Tax=Paenibacillus riograndensis SBR5 TaxID=1073571 RepID=A0A0E4HCX4_9BACL|nr:acetolactate decarboxylase [Paenibacillus riograndensis]CQR57594.1 Alpha-acetolactate decarboxylase [Paenibacillus riograndensis SBR5]
MKNHVIYQVSTMIALLSGQYDGSVSFGKLKEYGDFGIGTFHQLDGEMIAFDGGFYHLYPDGSARPVSLEESTPFSTVTFFEQDQTLLVHTPLARSELEQVIHTLLPSPNIFYAIRIDGHFREVHTRTVSHQDKPYKPFVEVTENEPSFHFSNEDGVIAGFWMPAFAQGIGVSGYHLHYINDARNGGGHVLDFIVEHCTISICSSEDLRLKLPHNDDYLKADLAAASLNEDIAAAEGPR